MRIIIFFVFALLLSACGTVANIDYDKNTDFKNIKTYQVLIKPLRIAEDTRINSPFMQQRIVDTLKTAFANKGLIFSATTADIEVKYYLDIKTELETNDSGLSIGFGSYSRHTAVGLGFNVPVDDTRSVDKLFLTIDIFSGKTNKLLWRGSMDDYLVKGATPESYQKLVNGLVTEILKNFPPK